jgi:hypothetical protein
METTGRLMIEQERLIRLGIFVLSRIQVSLVFQEELLLIATTGKMTSEPWRTSKWVLFVSVLFKVVVVEIVVILTVAVITKLWRLGSGRSTSGIGTDKYHEELSNGDNFKLIVYWRQTKFIIEVRMGT